MRRFYAHAGGEYVNGRLVCSDCGVELDDNLLSGEPCSIPTAWYTEYDEMPGLLWFIDVGGMRVSLMVMKGGEDGWRPVSVSVKDDEEEIRRVLEKCVYEAGGVISISGHYGLTDEAAHRVLEWLKSGAVKIG